MLDTGSRHSGLLDQGRSRDPTMMEWNLGTDHSLQDMLDCDITDEIDDAIGGHPELNFDVNSITPLGLDDYGSHSDLTYNWFGPQSLLNGNSDSSNSNYSNYKIDLSGLDAASIMVNPKSMVPHVSSSKSDTNANTTSKRHFPFALKFEPEDEKNEEEIEVKVESVDLDEADEAESEGEAEAEADAEGDYENELSEYESEDEEHMQNGRGLNVNLAQHNGKSKATILLPSSSIKTLSPQMQGLKAQQQSVKVNGITGIRLQNIKILPSSPGQMQQFRRQVYSNNNVQSHVLNGQQTTQQTQLGQVASSHTAQHKRDKDSLDPLEFDDKLYPKPAYSYSCLIAMALKNSQTGSLPVSEIYNFMCEHFPYFKTAPNGWKNSVRHNLSLNKCFEKIDKPAGSSNQRKGCLWAINPAKVAKMDEEVQKWSRKDPLAIKKAMIYPDHLELLERGEMKYIGGGSGSGGELSSDETESSADEVEGPGMSPATHQSHATSRHLAANSVTDSYDESSQDCDVDVAEQLYESIRTSPYDEIDIDEDNKDALRVQLNISSTNDTHDYQLNSNSKRQKTLTGTVQANYVYQPVSAARRKTAPLFLTTTATPGSFLKIE